MIRTCIHTAVVVVQTAMPRSVCVECGEIVKTAVHKVRGSSDSIRLSRCGECGQIADKYVEYDTLLILLDMLLHRASVYRHLLCNFTQHPTQEARRNTFIAYSLALLLGDPLLKGFGPLTMQPVNVGHMIDV